MRMTGINIRFDKCNAKDSDTNQIIVSRNTDFRNYRLIYLVESPFHAYSYCMWISWLWKPCLTYTPTLTSLTHWGQVTHIGVSDLTTILALSHWYHDITLRYNNCKVVHSGSVITRQFSPKYSRKTPHSSSLRARYGVLFWVQPLWLIFFLTSCNNVGNTM